MYKAVKKTALALVPKNFLIKNELFFRSLFAYRYKGNNHKCLICEHSLKKFIPLDDGDILCPFCGSRARTRRLFALLKEKKLLHGTVLHFSPSRSLYRILSKDSTINYVSTDFEDEFIAQYKYDITNIDCPDNHFDLIICYHILEHIVDDQKAMQELYRVLKTNSICLIQTPFRNGNDIYEDASITTEEGRLKAFGQEDHVRIYSVPGLTERLKKNGFTQVEARTFEEDVKAGFQAETILFLKK